MRESGPVAERELKRPRRGSTSWEKTTAPNTHVLGAVEGWHAEGCLSLAADENEKTDLAVRARFRKARRMKNLEPSEARNNAQKAGSRAPQTLFLGLGF